MSAFLESFQAAFRKVVGWYWSNPERFRLSENAFWWSEIHFKIYIYFCVVWEVYSFCLKVWHECNSVRENVVSRHTRRPGQEKALRVPRAVNMVDGLPRACKSIGNRAANQLLSDFAWMMCAYAICVRQTRPFRQNFSAGRREERLYESFRAVNIGWRFTARTKFRESRSQKWLVEPF